MNRLILFSQEPPSDVRHLTVRAHLTLGWVAYTPKARVRRWVGKIYASAPELVEVIKWAERKCIQIDVIF